VLREQGFVVHLPEQRRYGLGFAAFELGSAYARQEPLRWIAGTVLSRLVDASTHNGHLAVLHGRDVLYLVEERAPRRPSLVTDVGVRLPAHLTATGRAMLAELPPAQLRALYPDRAAFESRHPATEADAVEWTYGRLKRVLADVRARGTAHEDGEVTFGLASVGAAVVDHLGWPAAAIAVTFQGDAAPELEPVIAPAVQEAAATLSRRIRGSR
jgi:DNA-binding IclR family transcriptional regulator